MSIGMSKVLHVKLPVSDLQTSAQWYADLMDLTLTHEFIEEGELRGAALKSDEGEFSFALRLREHCAGRPDLTGFDVVALHMQSRDALVRLRERCADLGVRCSDVQDRSDNEAVVDVPDPDGTVLRFYWVGPGQEQETFRAIIFEGDAPPRIGTESRLRLHARA